MTDNELWVVLELTSKAEGEDPDVIKASIRHHIRDAEVFVPASVVERGGIREYHYLVDGYAFIKHKHPDQHYSRLEDTKYVLAPLKFPTGYKKERKLSTVTSEQIVKMKAQIVVEVDQGIDVGDRVMITAGPYKNIVAEVKEEILEADSVVVHVQLRSTARLLTFPRAFLKLESKSPVSAYRDRFRVLSTWAATALLVAGWDSNRLGQINALAKDYRLLERWASQDATLVRLNSLPSLGAARAMHKDVQLLDKALTAVDQIIAVGSELPSISEIRERQREESFLRGLCQKLIQLYEETKVSIQNQDVLNLVVDGTQLFIRCAEAPGLNSLKDSQGRFTGAVVGFLRSLGSYRKRFPKAEIYVCWDGNSQRRKTLYPDYKGNRASRSGQPDFGWGWLREVLPLLGVHQAFNPQEEADDVMASLVRGPLAGASNVMVTSDRDLLQVVSDSTYQLCPAVGAGKEKLYDPSLVALEYGVEPSSMVQLRALVGDTSDHIPGVPGFGQKTAAKTLQLYGTVQRLLGSSLAGMSKAQVANLRSASNQVLLNLELMTLRDVAITEIKSNPNVQEAETRINGLEMKPGPVLSAFFPNE